jgi:hypothetical protein
MNTSTMIRSLIDAADEENADIDSNFTSDKATDFGNVQFGARHKAWSFAELEELDPLYRNFHKSLTKFLEECSFKSPDDQDRVIVFASCF